MNLLVVRKFCSLECRSHSPCALLSEPPVGANKLNEKLIWRFARPPRPLVSALTWEGAAVCLSCGGYIAPEKLGSPVDDPRVFPSFTI